MTSELETSTLLEWINSFSLGTVIRSSNDLSDGSILWEILQDIDPQYFLGNLPENAPADHWVPKWQNLKHIHKLLITYIRNQNDGEVPAGLSTVPDLKAIAESASVKDTNRLLKLLLMAAISSPHAESYITTMQELSTQTQEGLKDIIQEAQSPSEDRLEQINYEQDEYRARRDIAMDPELQFEERVGKLLAENDKLSHEKKELEKALEDLHDRLAKLQETNDTLETKLSSTEDRLATLKAGKGDLGPDAVGFESRNRQQEDIIASQEARLIAAQDEIDTLRMSLESMRQKNERYQKLQDDYDEIKNERDQLSRKANAAEKYRQKLQVSQDFEKENQTLKIQVKDLKQQLMESDSNQRLSSEHSKELHKYKQLITQIEQDHHEIQNLKKQLEFDNHALNERLQGSDEQHSRDEATIAELRERIRELEGLESPGTATPKDHGTFQRDLDEAGKREAQLNTEKEELRKELGKVKGNSESPESDIENKTYRKLHEEYATLRTKLSETESRAETTERELSDARIDLGLVDKDKLDILNEIKESNASEIAKMRADWDTLQNRVRELEGKLDVSRTIVREVCSERNALRAARDEREEELRGEDQVTLYEMKKLLEELASRINGTSDKPESSPLELLKEFADTTEKSAENLTKRVEHIKEQNVLIKSLQERIEHYEDFSADLDEFRAAKEREAELMQVVQRQAREIALISSAWYNFQSRLQNQNAGGMARYHQRGGANGGGMGSEVGRTWLVRQRAMVGGVGGKGAVGK
ncbi:hypothetical protein CPC735_038020 [Coccidioides posadasii C735 delta SOWgp]|uniref:HOOK N-terminal domain-containing protein n=1 Tax=Coccidioides posadasii (strain C735) TaxID=222929 RepID=C5P2J3_COCP7|nr:hypothetical protein CPC735_038020 [Coccidioides posadasii C735 delta SOWgp]EER29096.1 hypothetical protein CPC735_038020 [Coccidioides posadasii C735 delta SOWgp]|eukprot:XP_003071241.1 hypothetical protein CPC735_038020 [Coccidioides posadasii C735 delta SOWgp]